MSETNHLFEPTLTSDVANTESGPVDHQQPPLKKRRIDEDSDVTDVKETKQRYIPDELYSLPYLRIGTDNLVEGRYVYVTMPDPNDPEARIGTFAYIVYDANGNKQIMYNKRAIPLPILQTYRFYQRQPFNIQMKDEKSTFPKLEGYEEVYDPQELKKNHHIHVTCKEFRSPSRKRYYAVIKDTSEYFLKVSGYKAEDTDLTWKIDLYNPSKMYRLYKKAKKTRY